jgi:hypothetical protein
MYIYPRSQAPLAPPLRPMGDDTTSCPSCWEGYGMAFLIGGLMSAVVILAAAPAARLHKEYTQK